VVVAYRGNAGDNAIGLPRATNSEALEVTG
jgi:hypothetical protein